MSLALSSWWFPALAAWGIWVLIAHWLSTNPKGDPLGGVAFAVNALYCRLWHGVRYEGLEHLPRPRTSPVAPDAPVGVAGGLIVVANHTAGIDPLVVQNACRFYIRWMMTEEMRIRPLNPFWDWIGVIFVGADGTRAGASELAALKTALGVVKSGGVLGIFPEGRIARPHNQLHTFQPGLGLIVARANAPVLPVIITGTPLRPTCWSSLFFPSRTRVRFLPTIDYRGHKPAAIVADLHRRYEAWTLWPPAPPADAPPQ